MNRLAWLTLKPGELRMPSAILLIAANMVPLYGVLFLDWHVFPILLLFWTENVIVGAINVLKMLVVSPGSPLNWLFKAFMIPFFCLHYGLFTLAHGVFVFGLFGGYFTSGSGVPDRHSLFQAFVSDGLAWAVIALFLSHALSFWMNYIGRGEYKHASVSELMMQPYNRVVVLHVTILIGGFVAMSLGSPVGALLVLILIKVYIDIQAHIREHRKYRNRKKPDSTPPSQTPGDALEAQAG